MTGTVEAVEILPRGRRITVARARLGPGAPPLTRLIRLRLRDSDTTRLRAGDTVRVRAMVRPPPPPAYPGAWDVQRDEFFDGYGGGGYALGPSRAAGPRRRRPA